MNTWTTRILVFGALLAAAGLGFLFVNSWYLKPRSELQAQIAANGGTVVNYRKVESERRSATARLQEMVDRTLGANLETVDHRLRSRLNRLAEQSKLQGVSVSTEAAGTPRLSPARAKFRAASQKALREEIDFVELQGSISGVGALADVVKLITAIEAEPWIKRIDEVRLDPRDNGARVAVSLHLTTLFLPGRQPGAEPASPSADDAQARFASLVDDNPFRVPPPPKPVQEAAPAQPVQPTPPPPPPFPFGEWALTGVVQGPGGLEAWLLHRPSGETRVLGVGGQIDTAVFAGAAGEAAEFTVNGQRFNVAVGSTLDQRTPTGQ